VTVKNADQGGNTFVYNQTLALGATTNAKRLEFNDPAAQMFSFDAKLVTLSQVQRRERAAKAATVPAIR